MNYDDELGCSWDTAAAGVEIERLKKELAEALATIAKMVAAQAWHPTSEPPNNSRCVLIKIRSRYSRKKSAGDDGTIPASV